MIILWGWWVNVVLNIKMWINTSDRAEKGIFCKVQINLGCIKI